MIGYGVVVASVASCAGGVGEPVLDVELLSSTGCGSTLARAELRHLQRHSDDALAHIIGDAVPDALWP